MFDTLIKFINYWWFRYLMVTELYIVEKWERCTIHAIFLVIFLAFWYFNYVIVLTVIGQLLGFKPISVMHDHEKNYIVK